MRWVLVVVGILLMLVGVLWLLQGTNVLTGSPVMSGHSLWTLIGAIVGVVGIVFVVLGATRRKTRKA